MLEGSKDTKSTNMLSHEQYWGHTWLIWVSFEWSILKQSSNCECCSYLYFNLPEASTAAFEMHSLPLVVSSITLARLKFAKFILLYFGNFMSCHVHFLKLLCIFSLYRSAIKNVPAASLYCFSAQMESILNRAVWKGSILPAQLAQFKGCCRECNRG